ncbi:hypothetical protein SARC_02704 [Sphaeroforma arctica JP610]|uniref:Methyltransferase FkbM domain-containing protein n=1 Tax=Sphaeroforma arctica JP610 TaxID=667725 RepID=A0A0L0G885_9EUKA|nr:hypothetical protein SARC_02704 [Sphaeroforma arctica JP610]KNC85114.1 hypothetical protein SARC_02704 [Sphaeroforma arctica JP610]|eukprot:XP_014159016.1 hypothetical protein SARC_02704 [Sphaeroforma arctica JP610]
MSTPDAILLDIGPVVMTTLTDAKRKSSESWTEGISSLGENAGDLKRYSDKDKATVKVHGITLQHLLEELRIEPGRLNILQIDAECYDARILLQWPDLEEHRPTVINIEWSCINTEERCQLIQRLVDAGYTHFDHTDKDFTAVIAA